MNCKVNYMYQVVWCITAAAPVSGWDTVANQGQMAAGILPRHPRTSKHVTIETKSFAFYYLLHIVCAFGPRLAIRPFTYSIPRLRARKVGHPRDLFMAAG